ELSQQMLAYAGRRRFALRECDLGKLLEKGRALLQGPAMRNELEFQLAEAMPPVRVEASQIQQLVANLVLNATEAGARHITIATRRVELTPEECDRSNELGFAHHTGRRLEPGPHTLLSVEDDGAGIPEEALPRIFEPFFTTKTTGRGIGLAAAMGIVRGHGAGLRVSTTQGRGTRFEIVFPDVRVRPLDPTAEDRSPAEHPRTGTVLVVDDAPEVRALVASFLSSAGHRWVAATEGASAVELYGAKHAEIDVVLLDMSTPGLSVSMTRKGLRAIDPRVPIILTSRYDREVDVSEFSGGDPFIPKPLQREVFLRAIDRALRNSAAELPHRPK
ncbi:MAG: response regulator, partial [Planctomycetes bacterium]|nr:response regulator [Planctomycetota bacterium]